MRDDVEEVYSTASYVFRLLTLNMARDFPIGYSVPYEVGPIHHVSPYRRLVLLYDSDRTRQRTDDDQTTSERCVQALLVRFSDLSLLASLRLFIHSYVQLDAPTKL
jgi:hypothetical protein